MYMKATATPSLVLVLGALLICAPHARSEPINMQVAFEDIPGAKELHAGDFERGIALTESELERGDASYRGPLLANLCAAYVMTRDFVEAQRTCDEAAEEGSSAAAFNNRGVLRVLTGDVDGARKDFSRIRPVDVDAYIELIKQTDPRFLAQDNLSLLDRVEPNTSFADERRPLRLEIPTETLDDGA